jgi:hypothetical protein
MNIYGFYKQIDLEIGKRKLDLQEQVRNSSESVGLFTYAIDPYLRTGIDPYLRTGIEYLTQLVSIALPAFEALDILEEYLDHKNLKLLIDRVDKADIL